MNISFKHSKDTFDTWVVQMRKDFDCDLTPSKLKTWEFFMLIGVVFCKEIIDTLIATFSHAANLSDLCNLYPLNINITWTLILKLGLGYISLLYLQFKYHDSSIFKHIFIFWIFCVIYSSIDDFQKNDLFWDDVSSLVRIVLQFLLVVYFFSIDGVHLDSLKMLLYDNLYVDLQTKRVYRTPNSRISTYKLKKLFATVGSLVISAMFLLTVISIFISFFKGSSHVVKPENQKNIEARAKYELIQVIFGATIMAPILEEWIYRRCIMKMGNWKWWTILVSSFIFSLIHLTDDKNGLKVILSYLIPGLVFGTGLFISKNIWHTIISHSLYNTITLFVMLLRNP